jgi:hypothetical protein
MRSIPDPGFPGDSGDASPEVSEALRSYAGDPEHRYRDALLALQHSRLLVPVVATAGEVEHDAQGLARDKTSDMAAVLMQGRDGRLALLAFTGTATLAAWNPEARPVPVAMQQAARAAVDEGAAALVVDVAGPAMFVVETDDLQALADGFNLAEVDGGTAWVRRAAQAPERRG